jgi:hypothetical protein
MSSSLDCLDRAYFGGKSCCVLQYEGIHIIIGTTSVFCGDDIVNFCQLIGDINKTECMQLAVFI